MSHVRGHGLGLAGARKKGHGSESARDRQREEESESRQLILTGGAELDCGPACQKTGKHRRLLESARPAKYRDRTRPGTIVPIHVFQGGLEASPALQYSVATKSTTAAETAPCQAAITTGTKLSPWIVAQTTTQRRCEPKSRTPRGENNCVIPPASCGTLATNPATTSPSPAARTNAGKYVSPVPTITPQPAASPTLERRSRPNRSARLRRRAGGRRVAP